MIETARLLLRPFESGDTDTYAAIRGNPAVAKYLPGGADGASDAAVRIKLTGLPWGRQVWDQGGFAPWAAVEKASGRLIGHLGLRHLPEIGETELLYMIDVPLWGQGLATEGGRAAVSFARHQLGLARLVAFAVPRNVASIAVMRALGFRYSGQQAIFGLDAARHELKLGDSE